MNIDTSKIEGYADMTPEQKLEALEKYDIPDPDYSGYVKKDTFDKTASELAKLKKEKTSAEGETKAKETQLEALMKEVEELKKDKQVATYTNQYLGLGYEKALAEETALAIVNGDTAKVFENQKKFQEELEKKIKADLMKNTPKLGSQGEPEKPYTKDELNKLSVEERYAWISAHPDAAKTILGGE